TIARYQSRISAAYGLDNHFTDMVMGVINQIVSLKDYATMSPAQIKKIDNDWHHLFILLNGQIGVYDSSRATASNQNFFARLIKNPIIVLFVIVAVIIGGFMIGKHFLKSQSQQEEIISYDE
ncbi:MAG: hypothetical protein Q8Q33_04170, partial [Chlamydiota bacterium]|nr:hypothetical protein [Chlamydiota bacterium]